MQLYHHPYSLDSQKVRLALEENGIDYTSHHVNPITGKNMDSLFFRKNQSAKLPVFQNGAHIIFDTIEIIQDTFRDERFSKWLARLVLLDLEDEYITSRPNIAQYWVSVRQRPSYRKVIGKYFNGWRKYRTLTRTWCFVRFRSLLRRY